MAGWKTAQVTSEYKSNVDFHAITVKDLKKNYGRVQAVKGVDLDVRPGEIFGLIGPDGAGKTSTFQVLGGVMEATSGTAEMLGIVAREARQFVGYLTQAFSLYPDLTVHENLQYIGQLRRVSKEDIDKRGMRYLEAFGMAKFTERLAGRLSGGMKQKLALACALVTEPKILLLDEPTTGVDPVSRREFWDALANLSADGMTIMVATPYLDEAERCHRVALMYDGVIHEVGTPKQIRDNLGLKRLEVRTPLLSLAEDQLTGLAGLGDVQRFGDRLDVMVKDPVSAEKLVRGVLPAEDLDIHAAEPALENAFVSILRDLGNEPHAAEFPARHKGQKNEQVAIGSKQLVKTFGDFTAVKGVSLEVKYGEIYGLLGANGAGKTTTIKMLCGLLGQSSGTVTLAGETGKARSRHVREQIGYMSQKFSLYDDLTIEQNLDFFAGVYGVPAGEIEEKKKWVLEFAGLEGKGKLMTGSLPGGWKQRVAFGAAIMHEPKVLFLDEPTSGVDPIARRAFWRMINKLSDQGTAILVTTHYLEEAEQCNRLGFMVAGELVAEGTPTSVKKEQGGRVMELTTSDPQKSLNYLKEKLERWRVSLFGDRLHVIVDGDPELERRKLDTLLRAGGIQLLTANPQNYSLEDVFLVIIEKARREGKEGSEE